MTIVIDSVARGPALGGCRWQPYADSAAALADASALASAMTRKAAMARLSLGGGKAVIRGDPRTRTREQLLAFGEFVDSLDGRYITAADMGTGEEAMAVIRESTYYVVGLPQRYGGAGDPGPFTALGVFLALERACRHRDLPLPGAQVAVQGVGSVGRHLVSLLREAGAAVYAADPDRDALDSLPDDVIRVPADRITREPCDVFAPCGPGGVIECAEELACQIVCGAANNPLARPELARDLAAREILYVPDFVANAGGLIRLGLELGGESRDAAAARRHLEIIPENVDTVFAAAKSEQIDTASVADRIALGRVEL